MKNRILQLMKNKGMSQQEFSRATGISPASLSSIFTGRTAPTMKHAEALHRFFPQLNMAWLMFGEGEMFQLSEGAEDAENGADRGGNGDGNLPIGTELSGDTSLAGSVAGFQRSSYPFDETSHASRADVPTMRTAYGANKHVRESNSHPSNYDGMLDMVNYHDKKQRRIVEIRIFFDDGTFETFQGNS